MVSYVFTLTLIGGTLIALHNIVLLPDPDARKAGIDPVEPPELGFRLATIWASLLFWGFGFLVSGIVGLSLQSTIAGVAELIATSVSCGVIAGGLLAGYVSWRKPSADVKLWDRRVWQRRLPPELASSARPAPAGGIRPAGQGRPKVLLICGSLNQTTQMEQVGEHLSECDCYFTPYYSDHWVMVLGRKLRLQEWGITGYKLRGRCLDYLRARDLPIDLHGERHAYDLVVTSSDLVIPPNILDKPIVAVQEGILDPPVLMTEVCKRLRFLPRWLAGTTLTGLSGVYDRFCVASEGYRRHFAKEGADPDRLVVTGIPNFDDCDRYRDNDFPYRNYLLVCTSDARETFKRDDRQAFIERCVRLARGRQIIFKLHPNENFARAVSECRSLAPEALVYRGGSAEQMVANCDELVCQWSSLVFVGLALGKKIHTYFDEDEVRQLVPVQNRRAAANIAAVCREVLAGAAAGELVVPEGRAAALARSG